MVRIGIGLAICWMAAGQTAWGQADAAPADTGAKTLTYEVVSIKPDKSGSGEGGMSTLSDGFRWTNVNLYSLVRGAYGLTMDSQVTGLPDWARSEPYDIEAKVDAETAETWKSLSQKERWVQEQPMMQAVLTDRCHFKAHQETRELPVYDLVIAKGGLKMKESPATEGSMEDMSVGGRMVVRAMTVNTIVFGFAGSLGRMIVDKSGLGDKKFDFKMTWTPENQRAADSAADAGPDLFTALEEQLGLKLVPDKGPVDVLVIDHMERPSPN